MDRFQKNCLKGEHTGFSGISSLAPSVKESAVAVAVRMVMRLEGHQGDGAPNRTDDKPPHSSGNQLCKVLLRCGDL
ncbi:unnamed protein product [Knipowitschia caucasica]